MLSKTTLQPKTLISVSQLCMFTRSVGIGSVRERNARNCMFSLPYHRSCSAVLRTQTLPFSQGSFFVVISLASHDRWPWLCAQQPWRRHTLQLDPPAFAALDNWRIARFPLTISQPLPNRHDCELISAFLQSICRRLHFMESGKQPLSWLYF